MKIFKKVIAFAFLGVMLFSVIGCGKKNIEGSLEDIMTTLQANIDSEMLSRLENHEITSENISFYVGTDDIKFTEGIASEHLTGSVAYSVVLLRVDDSDVENVKTKIKENIDPRKWICVGVEPENVIIKNKGNLVIAIVVENEEYRNSISTAFDNL